MIRRTAVTATEDSLVLRPALVVIAKDIIRMIGVKSGISVKYDGEELLKKNASGGIASVNDTPMEYLEILASYEAEDNGDVFRTPLKNTTEPLFHHVDSGCKLTTVYSNTEMLMNIKYKTKSKASANILKSNLRILISGGNTLSIHTIDIGYVLPKVVKRLINIIYDSTKDVDDVDLDKFIKNTFTSSVSNVDLMNHLSGDVNKSELTIREQQTGIKGRVVGTVKNEDVVDGEYHVVEYEYRVSYARPLAIQSEYPMLVYNNYLEDLFYNKNSRERRNVKYLNNYGAVAKLLERHNSFGLNASGYYLSYPAFDDFNLDNQLRTYYPIITILSVVEKDTDIMFNIENLDTLKFKKSVIEFLKSEHEYLGLSYMSLFYFALYKDNTIDTSNRLVVDKSLNIRPMNPLDIKSCYRVVIYMARDLTSLDISRRRTIINYCDDEIDRNKDLVREASGFATSRHKDTVRDNGGVGLESIKVEPLLLDVYFNFFDVKDDEIYNAANRVSSQSTADAMFKVQIPDFGNMLTSCGHTTVVSSIFEEED